MLTALCLMTAIVNLHPLQHLLNEAVARNHGCGGGVLRIDRLATGLVWQGAAGQRSQGEPGSMVPEDSFEIASITKVFTAVAVLQLVEQQRVALEGTVGALLPAVALPKAWQGCTVRQLLSHTSGLPDYWTDPPFRYDAVNVFLQVFLDEPQRFWRPRQILQRASGLSLFEAGLFHYADTNYVLLSLILEAQWHRPLHEVFQETIFKPLDLQHTYMSYRQPAALATALSHRYEGTEDLHGQLRQSADWGGGGLVSTTHDLARFMAALAAARIFIHPETLTAMMQWRATGDRDVQYGLGLFQIKLDDEQGELWGHDGHGNSFMYYWPQKQITFVGTLNQLANEWWPLVTAASDEVVK